MGHCIIKQRPISEEIDDLSLESPLLERIYRARGIHSQGELDRSLKRLIPFTELAHVKEAAELILSHAKEGHSIVVVGDFDTDGATSVATMISAMQDFGIENVHYVIPNRFEYGYGLSIEIVDEAAERFNPKLLITVDCGVTNVEGVAHAKKKGMDVVVTDHHLPDDELPDALIVNPNLKDSTFPSKNLAGVGVAFYTMLALRSTLNETGWFETRDLPYPNMAKYLDLVALGTVADVVPLDYNNRLLVFHGLLRVKAGRACTGLKAILAVSQRNVATMTASDLSYAVAPRLNAAGRLSDMSIGVACLLSDDPAKSDLLAAQLHDLNYERRQIEVGMQQDALEILKSFEGMDRENTPFGVVLYDEHWHQGVVGILASRVKDMLNKPVIVFTKTEEGALRGSARSIDHFNIRDAIGRVAEKLPGAVVKFGGHANAAGLTIASEQLAAFKKAFDEEVRALLTVDDFYREVLSDGPLASGEFNLDTAAMVRDAGPWGQAFQEPMFDNVFNVVEQRIVGQRHLKMALQPEGGFDVINAICFNVDLAEWPNESCQKIRAVYRLDINEYRGTNHLQLVIHHFEQHEALIGIVEEEFA